MRYVWDFASGRCTLLRNPCGLQAAAVATVAYSQYLVVRQRRCRLIFRPASNVGSMASYVLQLHGCYGYLVAAGASTCRRGDAVKTPSSQGSHERSISLPSGRTESGGPEEIYRSAVRCRRTSPKARRPAALAPGRERRIRKIEALGRGSDSGGNTTSAKFGQHWSKVKA